MANHERCTECTRPVGVSGLECPAQLLGATDADHDACSRFTIALLRARLALADRVAEAARSVKVSIETGHQQALAAELLGALIDYDASALFKRPN
jgi:hypothetical protein